MMNNFASIPTQLISTARRSVPVLAVLVIAGTLSGCFNPEWRALQQARLLWEANGIYGYSYDLQVNCFCPSEITRPVRVVVQNDQPVSVEYIDTADSKEAAPSPYFERYDTMDELFDIVETGIVGDAETVEAEYDPAFGFPAQVYIDESLSVADEEIGWRIENFVPFRTGP